MIIFLPFVADFNQQWLPRKVRSCVGNEVH